MRLADVDFWWRRPTIAALMTAGVDLGQAMASAFGGGEGRGKGAGLGGGGGVSDDDDDGDDEGGSGGGSSSAPSPSSPPSTPSFELSVIVSALRIAFLYEDEETSPPLGRAAVETLSLTLTAGGGGGGGGGRDGSRPPPSSGLTLVATL